MKKKLIHTHKLLLTLLILGCLETQVSAQSVDISFQRISLQQGLSQSIVSSMVQDSRGFMWICTEDGLNVYNGYEFNVIRSDPEKPKSLSYNQTTTIYEDRKGNLWIGTFNGGLNKHDPYTEEFTCYLHDSNDPNSLSNNIVRAIYEDKDGNLWIGTDNGLNQLIERTTEDGRSITAFIHYVHDPEDPNSLSHNLVRTIYKDHKGTLWIGTEGGLNKLVQKSRENEKSTVMFNHYLNDPQDHNSLSHNRIRAIFEDHKANLWIGTDNGLNKLVLADNENTKPIFIRYQNLPSDPYSLSHNEVYAIYEDQSGVLWIGTNGGGLNRFDQNTQHFVRYQNDPMDLNSLSYDEVRSIYEDRSGILWIGTYGGGVNKINPRTKHFLHYKPDPNDPNSLNEEIVWCIYEDQHNILWIGTNGGGLNRFDQEKNWFTHYLHDPDDPKSLSSDIVRLVLEDRSGTLWIGTQGGGLNRFDPVTENFTRFQRNSDELTSLSHNNIRVLYEDRSGTLWIGTRGGGLNKLVPSTNPSVLPTFIHYRHNPQNPHSLSNDFIRVIFEDLSGSFWIGTLGGGLNKFDRETETFTHYRADPDNPNSLNSDFIFSMYEDKSGILWVGTWGGGLNRFDPAKQIFTHYTEEEGLPNNSIYGILEDKQGYLWFSTNNGLSKFNPKTEIFKNYTVTDGLQSNEFNGGSFFKNSSGKMFFGGINGFNTFYPEDIKDNPQIPQVVITAFQKMNQEVRFDKPISEIEELRLSYKDYIFSFEFAALDYTAPEKNQYAYKMEGLDKDWIYTDASKRYVSYTTLAPGKYVFRVKGSNNDGVWNEKGASINITIYPPFWKTWWFRAIISILLVGLVFFLYLRRLKEVRMITELKTAHNTQMSIMPQSDPQIPGFEISGACIPAHEVGGDFFDYLWFDRKKTRFGIVIGDVSGKAMKGAMTAVMASGMIYASIRTDVCSVREIMTRLNHPIYDKTDKQMFVALCLTCLDLKTKKLTLTNAGLNEPLLKSRDSVSFIKAVGSKYPLGLVKNNVYKEKSLFLNPLDVFILISDGITETRNHTKELYGETRLQNLFNRLNTATLSAKEIKTRILDDVRHFSGSATQNDDMTLVVVKVTP